MVKEDEDVVADIEVAGRLLTDTINKDSRFAFRDLQDALESARHSSHRYTIPPKEVNWISEFLNCDSNFLAQSIISELWWFQVLIYNMV